LHRIGDFSGKELKEIQINIYLTLLKKMEHAVKIKGPVECSKLDLQSQSTIDILSKSRNQESLEVVKY